MLSSQNSLSALGLDNAVMRNPASVGVLLRRARRAKGLNQTQLAKLAGVHQTTISLIETNVDNAKLGTLFKILSALQLDLKLAARGDELDDYADLF